MVPGNPLQSAKAPGQHDLGASARKMTGSGPPASSDFAEATGVWE